MNLATPTDVNASPQVRSGEGWGMTETGPVGSLSWVKGDLAGLPENERARLRAKQGLAMPLIELLLIGDKELRAKFEDYKLPTG